MSIYRSHHCPSCTCWTSDEKCAVCNLPIRSTNGQVWLHMRAATSGNHDHAALPRTESLFEVKDGHGFGWGKVQNVDTRGLI